MQCCIIYVIDNYKHRVERNYLKITPEKMEDRRVLHGIFRNAQSGVIWGNEEIGTKLVTPKSGSFQEAQIMIQ